MRRVNELEAELHLASVNGLISGLTISPGESKIGFRILHPTIKIARRLKQYIELNFPFSVEYDNVSYQWFMLNLKY